MAFFGSDGLENTNKQLTKQLASKNAELAFMKNERDTRARELSEAKRTIEVLEARNEGFELERERWESLKDGKSGPVEVRISISVLRCFHWTERPMDFVGPQFPFHQSCLISTPIQPSSLTLTYNH
ncbi:hypothetical protein BCR39DRAFT_303530 [Naematelia encephala]|uniref:Uncharacterized protein n=1 Tax=Naematelia encephala TaxID=71784 RepID=A0A1Y2BFZ8_9TREE|nr:hypothetical protein BCR39DRAFT_303530 [Naematelia encephala]